MNTAKLILLLAGHAFIASNASPCSQHGSHTTSVATTTTTTTTSPPADTTCNMEGKRTGLSGLHPLGSYVGAKSPSACADICSDEHHVARCKSFTYTPSSKTCILWDIPVNVGGKAVPGTGVFYWDIECWPSHTASSTTTAPTHTPTNCLPADAICDKEGTFSDYDQFATYRGAESASDCFDICNDSHHADRCVSFIYGIYSEMCYFYDVPASVAMRPISETTNNYFWDKVCWLNSGVSCTKSTSSTSARGATTTTASTTAAASTTNCNLTEA
ncbi:hypothetical protein BGZ63DRAFT_406479 [Mariannaea sp. PMI_226]|nr:hypothetical protein BGZ63DRAFT_406479 [Mariannaea sp. PMI_226]